MNNLVCLLSRIKQPHAKKVKNLNNIMRSFFLLFFCAFSCFAAALAAPVYLENVDVLTDDSTTETVVANYIAHDELRNSLVDAGEGHNGSQLVACPRCPLVTQKSNKKKYRLRAVELIHGEGKRKTLHALFCRSSKLSTSCQANFTAVHHDVFFDSSTAVFDTVAAHLLKHH